MITVLVFSFLLFLYPSLETCGIYTCIDVCIKVKPFYTHTPTHIHTHTHSIKLYNVALQFLLWWFKYLFIYVYIHILHLDYNQAFRVMCQDKCNEHWVKVKKWKFLFNNKMQVHVHAAQNIWRSEQWPHSYFISSSLFSSWSCL